MQLRAGDLRHRITIEQPTEARQPDGTLSRTWSVFTHARAKIEPVSGREIQAQDQTLAQTTHQITMRWQDGITTKMRVVFGSQVFDILENPSIKDADRMITLRVMAGRSKGS